MAGERKPPRAFAADLGKVSVSGGREVQRQAQQPRRRRMSDEPLKGRTIRLPESEWAEIEEYRKRERAVTLTDAVRRLIREALRAAKRKRP